MAHDVITIACVGSSHIPALLDRNDHLIEPGMLERISENKSCSATFITRANSPISGHYHPEPEGRYHYTAIEHVSRESSLSIGEVLVYDIKNHIFLLQGKTKNLMMIHHLSNLIDKFEEHQYDENVTVGVVLKEWELGISSQRFKSHSHLDKPSLSNNPAPLFSNKKGTNTIQQFLNQLKQTYGGFLLQTPYKEIDDALQVERGSFLKS